MAFNNIIYYVSDNSYSSKNIAKCLWITPYICGEYLEQIVLVTHNQIGRSLWSTDHHNYVKHSQWL